MKEKTTTMTKKKEDPSSNHKQPTTDESICSTKTNECDVQSRSMKSIATAIEVTACKASELSFALDDGVITDKLESGQVLDT